MTPPLAIALVVLGAAGTLGLARLGGRLRTEIDALVRAFTRTEPLLAPQVAAVRSERDALAARLDDLGRGSGPPYPRR
jgi:hypothetical protein